jgi:VanZ family protein
VRRLAWRWGPAVAWAALIFALSAQPGLRISSDASVDGPARHLAHAFVYTVLLVLVVHGLGTLGRPLTLRTAAVAAAITVGYGITDEVHQTVVPERTGQAVDVAYDALGAALGLAIVWGWGVARRGRGSAPT